MEACVGAHHLNRKLSAIGHDAGEVRAPYPKRQTNDFRDAEADCRRRPIGGAFPVRCANSRFAINRRMMGLLLMVPKQCQQKNDR